MRVCQPPRIVFGDRRVLRAYLKAGLGRNSRACRMADVINGGMTPQAAVEKASTPSPQPAASLMKLATNVRHVEPYIGPCQLPDPVLVPGKRPIAKPITW
jgi:hypothetical protein